MGTGQLRLAWVRVSYPVLAQVLLGRGCPESVTNAPEDLEIVGIQDEPGADGFSVIFVSEGNPETPVNGLIPEVAPFEYWEKGEERPVPIKGQAELLQSIGLVE